MSAVFAALRVVAGTLPAIAQKDQPGRMPVQLPRLAAWIIGMSVGINLIFSGWSYISIAHVARMVHEGSS